MRIITSKSEEFNRYWSMLLENSNFRYNRESTNGEQYITVSTNGRWLVPVLYS